MCPDCKKAGDLKRGGAARKKVLHGRCIERNKLRREGGIPEDRIQLPDCTCQHKVDAKALESRVAG